MSVTTVPIGTLLANARRIHRDGCQGYAQACHADYVWIMGDPWVPSHHHERARCEVDGFGTVACVKFLEDILNVFVDCGFGNGKLGGNFAVFPAFPHQVENFQFAVGEGAFFALLID